MTKKISPHLIRVGDRIQFTPRRITSKLEGQVVVDVLNVQQLSGFIVIVATDGRIFSAADYHAEVVSYAEGLPNASYIAWGDEDHNEQVAVRYGHPANNVWSYAEKTRLISSDQLREIIGTSTPTPLEERN